MYIFLLLFQVFLMAASIYFIPTLSLLLPYTTCKFPNCVSNKSYLILSIFLLLTLRTPPHHHHHPPSTIAHLSHRFLFSGFTEYHVSMSKSDSFNIIFFFSIHCHLLHNNDQDIYLKINTGRLNGLEKKKKKKAKVKTKMLCHTVFC